VKDNYNRVNYREDNYNRKVISYILHSKNIDIFTIYLIVSILLCFDIYL